MRHALITGASSGIGLALARLLLERHDDLHLVALSRSAGELAGHQRFTHWPTDLGDLEATASRARRFRQEVGACGLLICAAGKGGFKPSDAWKPDELQSLVTLNLTSPMLLCAEMLPSLRGSEEGALVVLVGSTSARERAPIGAAYAATKAGLHRYSESLFAESRKQGIRVLHLSPGMTDTPFYESERFAPEAGSETALDAGELAELVDFFYAGPGARMNPTHLVLEPLRVGVRRRGDKERPVREERQQP